MNPISRRALFLALLPLLSPLNAAEFSLRLIDSEKIATGSMPPGISDNTFGGISGLDRASDGTYFAISDDRGDKFAGVSPRYYNVSIDYTSAGFAATPLTVHATHNMKTPTGESFASGAPTVDPEAVRIAPNGNLYWSSEGNYATATPSTSIQPFVREMTATGDHVRSFAMPTMFNYDTVNATATTGSRNNNVFEGLAVSPSGDKIFVVNEGARFEDGAIANKNSTGFVRMTEYDTGTGAATRQFAYEVGASSQTHTSGTVTNGVTELMALSENKFLALERSFEAGYGNVIRIVELTLEAGTTDILGMNSLMGQAFTSLGREVLLEIFPSEGGTLPDNVEALAWGHTLGNGNRSLILVSDNNFGSTQSTVLSIFEVTPVPEPGAWGVLGATVLGGLAALRRRKR